MWACSVYVGTCSQMLRIVHSCASKLWRPHIKHAKCCEKRTSRSVLGSGGRSGINRLSPVGTSSVDARTITLLDKLVDMGVFEKAPNAFKMTLRFQMSPISQYYINVYSISEVEEYFLHNGLLFNPSSGTGKLLISWTRGRIFTSGDSEWSPSSRDICEDFSYMLSRLTPKTCVYVDMSEYNRRRVF